VGETPSKAHEIARRLLIAPSTSAPSLTPAPVDADVAELQRCVNTEYLKEGAMDRIRAHMCDQSSVQMQDFLR
jgi:hypothetical protein